MQTLRRVGIYFSKLELRFPTQQWFKAYKDAGLTPRLPEEGDLMIAIDDAVIAAQNAVIAAESYGIGSCYIGDIMENIEEQRDILALPEYVFPAALVVFGYPTEQQKRRPKPQRSDLRYIVQENCYQQLDTEEIFEMIAKGRDRDDYQAWIRAFCARKYHSDFAREMNRSVREYLKQFSP